MVPGQQRAAPLGEGRVPRRGEHLPAVLVVLQVFRSQRENILKGLRGVLQPRPQVVHHCRGVGAALLVVAPVSALAAQLLQTEKERTKGGRRQPILPLILPLILPPHLQVLYRPIQAGDVLLDDQREVLDLLGGVVEHARPLGELREPEDATRKREKGQPQSSPQGRRGELT